MKKLLFFLTAAVVALSMSASPVDQVTATKMAERYLHHDAKVKRLNGVPAQNLKLLYTEVNSSRADLAAYYIFNSDQGFVIVSGDDRAQQVLAHGDRPLDLKRMPDNMKFWLGYYKKQIEYLHAHPGLVVDKPSGTRMPPTITTARYMTARAA